jgi:hypothetical protein
VTYSADIWDGREAHDSLGIATATTEADAIRSSKEWAKRCTSNPDRAWLRVNMNGVIHSFALGEL